MTNSRYDDSCRICGSPAHISAAVPGDDASRVECTQCGLYNLSNETLQAFAPDAPLFAGEQSHLLSAIVKRRSDRNERVSITHDNWKRYLEAASIPTTPMEQLDAVLLELANKQAGIGRQMRIDPAQDLYLGYCESREDLAKLFEWAKQLGYVDTPNNDFFHVVFPVTLSLAGWRRVEELKHTRHDSSQVFVSMWFDSKTEETYDAGIKPAIESSGLKPLRIDRDNINGKIDDEIVLEIRRSRFVVADFTGHRTGVYWEAGYAMALKIPVVHCCSKTDFDDVHFNIRQYNHIVYDDVSHLREQLEVRLERMLAEQGG